MKNSACINVEQQNFIYKTSFYFSVIFIIGLGYVLSFIPNDLNKEVILSTYNIDIKHFVVENSEKAQYILCTISFPIIFLGSYLLIRDLIKKTHFNRNFKKMNSIIDLIGFLIITSLIIFINLHESFYIYCYKKSVLIKDNIYSSLIVILLLYLLIMKPFQIIIKNDNILNKKYAKISIKFVIALLIFFSSYLFVTKSYYTFIPVVAHHFDAYFYPVYKVFSNQTPLIDFRSLYGFYPYFLAPLLEAFSSFNMYGFSVLMAILVGVSLLSVSILLYNLCEDKVLSILGVLSIFYTWVIFSSIPSDIGIYYLQYIPHRIISPTLLLLICMIFIRTKSIIARKIIYYFGYVFVSIMLLWNIDTGVVIALTYVSFHIYEAVYLYKLNDEKLYLKSFFAILMGILSILLAICILVLITYARTSRIINFIDIFYGQNIFYNSGFYMLNMPLIHPWILLIAIYLISLTKALRNIAIIRVSEPTYNISTSSFYFILSVLGLGLFSYYQGRSHAYSFSAVIWPGVILLVMLCQEYINRLRIWKDKNESKKDINYYLNFSKFIIVLSTLIFLSIGSITNIVDNNKLIEVKNKSNDIGWISEIVNLVESIRTDKEPVDLIMKNSAAVYSIMKEKMEIKAPATIDWFTKDDYNQVLEYIRNTDNLIIFDIESFNLLMRYNAEQFKDIIFEKNGNIDVYNHTNRTYIVFR